VTLPPWAARAEVLVEMAREQWDRFTDRLTAFDSAGHQVETTPLNHARGRQSFDVSARLAGHPVVFELLPAFARADAPSPWTASVRVRLFTDSGSVSIVASGVRLDVVPGGRAALPMPTSTPLALPEGFAPLVQWRLTPASGTTPDAVGFQPIRRP
jgi:hypothetical protein